MKFYDLDVELSGFGDIETVVRDQTTKAMRIAGCLNAIWCNKSMVTDTKSRIYKTVVRPVITCSAETRPETTKTERLLETAELKMFGRITGKTLLDRERCEDIRIACNVKNISKWVANRTKEWNEHISRTDLRRPVRIARDKSAFRRRDVERPRKRGSVKQVNNS
ncbi:uncharacterized protein LOC125504174 [Dendroctonus ponderosae]|uniref:uncharacterized protein LOC109539308 n=1 Tax=Dendroctonus ponderosae TaxID=77166 RepID=UPI002035F1FB|nr:uncharacterized protein LOC109539308 [Dendroctonus ponderosae]XP_048521313.1 uncharacterized protein LOC125504038 [Dendroctonus ponderosae]XP_048521723.1 uncharacterized protein LOC125504174 [Dendroctonus ponderosae]